MKATNRSLCKTAIRGLTALSISLCVISCATTIPQLQVRYTLPARSDSLRGKAITLIVEDQRASPAILGRGAQSEFGGPADSMTLTVGEAGQTGSIIGIFEAVPLVREALSRRLARLGVEILSERTPGGPTLLIAVKKFSLDLVGRNWVGRMSYEARLTGPNGATATQSVSGEAERYEFVGRDKADSVMSEIFTDMVNALNLPRLFEQAGL